MIYDTLDRLSAYAAILPGAAELCALLCAPRWNPEEAARAGFDVRRKAYETRSDAERRFEMHEHTVDLMVALSGAEVVHLCEEGALEPAEPLPGGADGRKLNGAPQGSAVVLKAGCFLAILPHEAHMVGGRVDGQPGRIDKLVVKLPAAQGAADACPCKSDCPRHGVCAECVVWHRNPQNSLPCCLREKGRLLVEKALHPSHA